MLRHHPARPSCPRETTSPGDEKDDTLGSWNRKTTGRFLYRILFLQVSDAPFRSTDSNYRYGQHRSIRAGPRGSPGCFIVTRWSFWLSTPKTCRETTLELTKTRTLVLLKWLLFLPQRQRSRCLGSWDDGLAGRSAEAQGSYFNQILWVHLSLYFSGVAVCNDFSFI